MIRLIGAVFDEYEGCVLDVDREEPELRAPATHYDRFWVLEREGRVVGCAACSLHLPMVEMKKIYLDADLRGTGWGRRLIEIVEREARRLGATRIEAWSDTRFTRAHAVYAHLGYEKADATRFLHDLSGTEEYHFSKSL
ncbi:MAG: GNAT family N-acetyltransferase [Planctomycetota bacterium]